MNICLINPEDPSAKRPYLKLDLMKRYFVSPYSVSHLGLGYLHAVLENEGHNVITIEMLLQNKNIKEIESIITNKKIQVVGISSYTHNVKSTLTLTAFIKNKFPNIFIVLGGYLPTLSPETLLKNTSIDCCVIGEGEETFKELIQKLDKGLNWNNVDGLAFIKKGDSKIYYTEPRKLISNLDALPFPNRIFTENSTKTVNIITSRGCYGNCNYCSINAFYNKCKGPKVRRRTPENFIEELIILQNEYGISHVKIQDDNFGIASRNDREWFMKFYNLIKIHNIKMNYWCDIRANEVISAPDILKKFIEIGLDKIAVGLESLVDSQLEFYNKNVSASQNIAALKIINSFGIDYNFNLIIFDPRSTLNEVIEFIQKLKNMNFLFTNKNILLPVYGTIRAFAGTEVRKYVVNNGCYSNNYHYYDFLNDEIKHCYETRSMWEKSIAIFDEYNSIYEISRKYEDYNLTNKIFNLYKNVYYMDLDVFLYICEQIKIGCINPNLYKSVEIQFGYSRDKYIKKLLEHVNQIQILINESSSIVR